MVNCKNNCKPLKEHLNKVKVIHDKTLKNSFGFVFFYIVFNNKSNNSKKRR